MVVHPHARKVAAILVIQGDRRLARDVLIQDIEAGPGRRLHGRRPASEVL